MRWTIVGVYVLNWYDVAITRIGLSRGFQEANSLMVGWTETWSGAALKLSIAGFICAFWWYTYSHYPKLVSVVSSVAFGGFLFGMIRNSLIVF